MQVRSSRFENDAQLPRDYTCQGPGKPPPLEWDHLPEKTKSLILVCDDPDAPKGTFYHWGVYNIPPDKKSFPSDPTASGFPQATNDAGKLDYHPPCPPPGDGAHHYRFQIWALDSDRLLFDETPTVEELMEKAQAHVLERSTIQARFQR